MYQKVKNFFYFPLAYYFFFFAKIKLKIWNPIIICITGSSGKTTLLHFLESQINNAHFSHKANSAFGIPFDILGIRRSSYSLLEWPKIFLKAPISIFKKPYKEKFYIAEADCDRPREGKFLANLLNPSITLWLSTSTTHTKNFSKDNFSSVEEAVAYEYGYFVEKTKDLVLANGDSELIEKQLKRTDVKNIKINISELKSFNVNKDGIKFLINNEEYKLSYILPRQTFYSILMTKILLDFLNIQFDKSFSKLYLPPGRSTLFDGIKNTKIIDSSYNSSLISLKSMLELLDIYPSEKKWVVIGDILELGEKEKEEHTKIAEILNSLKFDKIILVGPRTSKYTLENLKHRNHAIAFLNPLEALKYIEKNINGGETILFKGARFLEGIVEHLLKDKKDITKLCRREKVWQKRREKWGL